MKNTIYIHHHLGLGDHIICAGLVKHIATNNSVALFCKKKNAYNVSQIFINNTNISIIPIDEDIDVAKYSKHNSILSLGIALNNNFNHSRMHCCWDRIFYEQANIDFDLSWSEFTIDKPSKQNNIPSYPYGFICNTGSDGIDGIDYSVVDDKLKKMYSNTGKFFQNIDAINQASEIHCINSSYIHLVDRIYTKPSAKLYYHKNFIKKPYSEFTLKKNWNIV